jgi:hypothetical protein
MGWFWLATWHFVHTALKFLHYMTDRPPPKIKIIIRTNRDPVHGIKYPNAWILSYNIISEVSHFHFMGGSWFEAQSNLVLCCYVSFSLSLFLSPRHGPVYDISQFHSEFVCFFVCLGAIHDIIDHLFFSTRLLLLNAYPLKARFHIKRWEERAHSLWINLYV